MTKRSLRKLSVESTRVTNALDTGLVMGSAGCAVQSRYLFETVG